MDPLEQRAIEAVSNLGARSRNSRIPHEVREAVVAFGTQARQDGATWKQISDRVGLSASVLQRWCAAPSPQSPWSTVTVRPDVAATRVRDL